MKPETLTLLLVNLAGIMERADESVLLGIYKEVGEALHTDPVGLGLSPFYCHCLWRSFVACHDFSYYLFLHLLTGTRYLFSSLNLYHTLTHSSDVITHLRYLFSSSYGYLF